MSRPADLVLFLPYPPSLNNLFFTDWKTRRRPASAEYKAWQKTAGQALLQQPRRSLTGQVRMLCEFHRPDNRRRDLLNLEKGPTDLLVTHGVIEDDSRIVEATLRWVDDHPGLARISIWAL